MTTATALHRNVPKHNPDPDGIQVRVLRHVIGEGPHTASSVARDIARQHGYVYFVVLALERDGFVTRTPVIPGPGKWPVHLAITPAGKKLLKAIDKQKA